MKMLNQNVYRSQGTKSLPVGTIVILTQNNEEELQRLLKHLSTAPLFKTDGAKVIIIDHYSFDKTFHIALEFQRLYPDKIIPMQKSPEKTGFEQLSPFLSNQHIEVIHLAEINKNDTYLPPSKWSQWTEKTMNQLHKTNSTPIDPKALIERLQQDQQMVYNELRQKLLEPLSNIHMQLEHASSPEAEEVQIINQMIRKLKQFINHFDPDLYTGTKLTPCITSLMDEFTNRTQINCLLKESGTMQPLDYYIGISIIKILQEFFAITEQQGQAAEVKIRVRWYKKRLVIQTQADGNEYRKENLNVEKLRFIEERILILGGTFKLNSEKLAITLSLPIAKSFGDQNAP
jgi:hypothetical protein